MPNHEEHCQHTFKTIGVRGDNIHTWMDEPSRPFGSDHREFRHDSETVKLVGRIFAHRYGRKIAEEIALDHITLDHKEAIERRGYESSSLYERNKPPKWVINERLVFILVVFFAVGIAGISSYNSIRNSGFLFAGVLCLLISLLGFGLLVRSEIRYYRKRSIPPPTPVPAPEQTNARELIKEKEVIVKIRCRYCNAVFDETLDRCPNCGARSR